MFLKEAVKRRGAWVNVDLPKEIKTRGCKWVLTVKCNANCSIEQYKVKTGSKRIHPDL